MLESLQNHLCNFNRIFTGIPTRTSSGNPPRVPSKNLLKVSSRRKTCRKLHKKFLGEFPDVLYGGILCRNFWRYLQMAFLDEPPGNVPRDILRRNSWSYLQVEFQKESLQGGILIKKKSKKSSLGIPGGIHRWSSCWNSQKKNEEILQRSLWRNLQIDFLEESTAWIPEGIPRLNPLELNVW